MAKKKVIIIMDIEKGTAKMLQTKKSIEIFLENLVFISQNIFRHHPSGFG